MAPRIPCLVMTGTQFTAIPALGRGYDQEPWLIQTGLEDFQTEVAERLAGVGPPRVIRNSRDITNALWALGRFCRETPEAFLWIPEPQTGEGTVSAAYVVDPDRAGRTRARYLRAQVPLSSALRSPTLLRRGRDVLFGAVVDGSPHLLAGLEPCSRLPGLGSARCAEPQGVRIAAPAYLPIQGLSRLSLPVCRARLDALLIPFSDRGVAFALWGTHQGVSLGWSYVEAADWAGLDEVWAVDGSCLEVPPLQLYRGRLSSYHPIPLLQMADVGPIPRFVGVAATMGLSSRLRGM